MLLFAQAAPPGGGPPANLQWIMAGAFAFCGLIFIVILVVYIFFLLTLSKALNRCHPDNRTMSPGQVWLNFIPCFSLVWNFVTVIRVGDSLKTEFLDRRMDEGGDYGKTLGLACILVSWAGSIIQNGGQAAAQGNVQVALASQGVGSLMTLASLALGIIYWVKIAGYSRQLADDDEQRHGADDEYDDPDRPPRRPSPPADEPYELTDPPR